MADPKTQVIPQTIRITGIQPGTNDLIMSDNGLTKANKRDLITWIVDNNPGNEVESILAIFPKPDQDNVFENGPGPFSGPDGRKKWKGTIRDYSDTVTHKEDYTILYKRYNSEDPFSYDPTIQVNPTIPIT